MKTQTCKDVSFRNDPEALICLLYGLFDIASQKNGQLAEDDITLVARDLGYRGPVSSLCRSLVAQGFLGENSNKSYVVDILQKAAFRQFTIEYEHLVAPRRLSAREKVHLFRRLGGQGTETEREVLRILRVVGTLQEEFEKLEKISTRNKAERAILEQVQVIERLRVFCFAEKLNELLKKAEKLSYDKSVLGTLQCFQSLIEAEQKQATLNNSLHILDERQASINRISHDEWTISVLRHIAEVINKLVASMLAVQGPYKEGL